MDINDNPFQDNTEQNKKKKRHGNRRDQRFRRKCRARGMETNKIERLFNKNKAIEKTKHNREAKLVAPVINKNRMATTTILNEGLTQAEKIRQLKKRKRDVSSYTLQSSSAVL
jgi:hypothetical protein